MQKQFSILNTTCKGNVLSNLFLKRFKKYSFLVQPESSISFLEVFNSCAMMRFGCPHNWKCGLDWTKRLFVGSTEMITESLSHVSTILVFVAVEAIIHHNGWFQSYHSGHPHPLPHYASFLKSSFSTNYSRRHQMYLFMHEMFMCPSIYFVKYFVFFCEKSPSWLSSRQIC